MQYVCIAQYLCSICVVSLVLDGGGRVQTAGEGGGSTEGRFTPRERVCDIIRTGTNQKSVQFSFISCATDERQYFELIT